MNVVGKKYLRIRIQQRGCTLFLLPRCWEYSTNIFPSANKYLLVVRNDGCGSSCLWVRLCNSNLEIVMKGPDESPALSSLLFATSERMFHTASCSCCNLRHRLQNKREEQKEEKACFHVGILWRACKCDISLGTEVRDMAEVVNCRCEYLDLPDCWGSCGDITHSREIQNNAIGSTNK